MTADEWQPGLIPQEVYALLAALLSGMRAAFGDHLVGVYLRGSLAFGDFVPETSDLDILIVTERPVSEIEFTALAELHAQLAALPNPYAQRLEAAYIHRAALKRFQPGERHPTLESGRTLEWSEHRDNWVIERWTVREHGITLSGPDAKTLIDPISAAEIHVAVRARLRDWANWAAQPDDPAWLLPRSHQAYVVETICRALHTLASGALSSKRHASAWALATLPEHWHALVERTRAWRTDSTPDPSTVPEVLRFVRWATAEGQAVVTGGPDR